MQTFVFSYKSTFYQIIQSNQTKPTKTKRVRPISDLMNVCCFCSNPISCATLQKPEKPIKPQNSPFHPIHFHVKIFPFPPNFLGNQTSKQTKLLCPIPLLQSTSLIHSMEALNPFSAFPLKPKAGFSFFWRKALQGQTVKIDQKARNPTICKQVLCSQLQNSNGFFLIVISVSKK